MRIGPSRSDPLSQIPDSILGDRGGDRRIPPKDRTPILGECGAARQQHAGAERVEREEGYSLEREDTSIPGGDADRDSAEDQSGSGDIARLCVDGDEPVKPCDSRLFMSAEPRAADERECEGEKGDASCSESSEPSPRHQIADGDTGDEDRGDQETRSGRCSGFIRLKSGSRLFSAKALRSTSAQLCCRAPPVSRDVDGCRRNIAPHHGGDELDKTFW